MSILIDLKPNDDKKVSLYRLCDIWGFSEDEWTPVALRLQALFIEKSVADPATFKKSFVDTDFDGAFVGEFLYLLGGVKGGNWRWGMVGSVNGALLWKKTFDWLAGELGKALSSTPSPVP